MHDRHLNTLKSLLTQFGAALDEASRQLSHAQNLKQQAEQTISAHEGECQHAAGEYGDGRDRKGNKAPPGSDPFDPVHLAGSSRGG